MICIPVVSIHLYNNTIQHSALVFAFFLLFLSDARGILPPSPNFGHSLDHARDLVRNHQFHLEHQQYGRDTTPVASGDACEKDPS